MTRPRKQTVDWFPHSCTHGKTMFVLESRFGNDGYSFWFKLLELLGDTESHYIDCQDLATWHFICTRSRVDDGVAMKILNLLSEVGAIDKELWEQAKIVWSSNFVNGLAPAYRNRHIAIPVKPDNPCRKPAQPSKKVSEIPEGREGKGREGEKDIAPPGPADTGAALPIILFFTCPYFEVDFDYRMKLAKDYPALDDGRLLLEFRKMEDWISDNAHKKKFKANGHLGNPKLFIRNWLQGIDNIMGPGRDRPKSMNAIEKFKREHQGGRNG